MSTRTATCPGPDAIEALAHKPPGPGDTAHAALVAHVARCPECAEALRAARFANRFSRVLLGQAEAKDPDGTHPVIPGYRVEREISRGAQGVVYEAVQVKSGQRVAVKLLHERGHASLTSGARFGREIQIAGALSHPGIVRLLDSMVLADGSDALIMERIDGVSLAQWLERRPRPSREAIVDVLASVADALHHAHQRGVIHRDLKPTNILIDENGSARVLDFGIARWTDATREDRRVTLTGEFAGTLAYAAPEQVGGANGEQRAASDIRSDIYALGVIAYEAMTGAMPYAVHGSLETTIWNIVHAEPARATLQGLGTDLAIVLAKAIAKEPERRYQTAADLARDLRHAAKGEAIDARRDSRIYMLRKSIRRHRFGVAMGALIAAFAVVMLVVLAVSNAQLSDALRESRIERLRTLAATGSRAKAEAILWGELSQVEPRGGRRSESPSMMGVWSGAHELRRCMWAFMELQGVARCISRKSMGVADDSQILPMGPGRIVLVRSRTLDVRSLEGEPISSGAVLPEKSVMLAMTPDARHVLVWREGFVECWEIEDGKMNGPVGRVEMPIVDGRPPLAESRDEVVVVSSVAAAPVVLAVPSLTMLCVLSDGVANQRVWVSMDSSAVVYLAMDGSLREVVSRDGVERWRHQFVSSDAIESASTSTTGVRLALNEGRTCAVAMLPSATYVLDLKRPREDVRLEAKTGMRATAVVSPDGSIVAMASFGDSRLRLFDAQTLEEVGALTGHDRTVGVHGFSGDGRRIITIDSRYDVRIWDAPGHGWRDPLTNVVPNTLDPSLSPDGARLYFGADQRRLACVYLDDPSTPQREVSSAMALSVSCAPQGDLIASAAHGSKVWISTAAGGMHREVDAAPGERIQSVRFDPAGAHVVLGTMEGSVVLVRAREGVIERHATITPKAMISSVRFVGESGLLAVAARDGLVHLFDSATLELVRTVKASERQIRSLAVSPDARQIAAVGDSGQIILIHAASGRIRTAPRVSEDAIFCVAFHPDGSTLLVGDRAGVVTVVDAHTLSVLATFHVRAPVTSLIFEPGGDRVIVSAIGHRLERWDFAALAGTLGALRPGPAQ